MNIDDSQDLGLGSGALGAARPRRIWRNLPPARLVAEALRRDEARLSADGALVATTGRFTGRSPKDKFFVAYPELQNEIDWGTTNQPLEPRRFAGLLSPGGRPCRRPRAVRPGSLCRRRPGAPAQGARDHRAGLAQSVRAQHVHPPAGRRAARVRARLDGPAAAQPRGRSRDRRHQLVDRDRGRLPPAPRPDRRHRLCRRDQEVDLHRPQLPAAGRRRACRCTARPMSAPDGRDGRVLRPVRHRQDHALGRCQPHADRRRRAWLGSGRRVQLRGRLLRQGDPSRPRAPSPRSSPPRRGSARCWRTSPSTRRRQRHGSTTTA